MRIAVRLSPRARADRLDGVIRAADGTPVLKVSVTAPPAEGRANDALLHLLANACGVPRRDVSLVAGEKSRSKIVHVAGKGPLLMQRLAAALAALPRS